MYQREITSVHYLLAGIVLTSLFLVAEFAINPAVPQLAPGTFVSRFSSTEITLISITGLIWIVLIAALLITLFMHHRRKKQFNELATNSLPSQQMRLSQPSPLRPLNFLNPANAQSAPTSQSSTNTRPDPSTFLSK